MLLSVIICTYNREALLGNCLDALAEQMVAHQSTTEVIVVDNNCTDGTRGMVRQLMSRFHWIRYVHESKQGLSNARNCGAREARGEYLCYLDDDGKPGVGYLDSLHASLAQQAPDIMGGPIYPYYTSPKPAWFPEAIEIRKHAEQSGYSAGSISGGNFVIRARLLSELGMFSPDLGMVGGKVRLGEERAVLEEYRARTPSGRQRVYYSMDCFIYHHVPAEKMRVSYLLKRAYFSGRASVRVKKERPRSLPRLGIKLVRTLVSLPVLYLASRGGSQELAMAAHRAAVLAGKVSQHAQNLVWRPSYLERRIRAS